MLNYSTSPPAAMVAAKGTSYVPPTDSLNIRDVLSGVIGKGFTDLKNDDARNAYAYLRSHLGYDAASKLMTHALMFNQRQDMLKASPQQKVQSFYDIGSNDPELHEIITRAGKVSYGPMDGLNTSPDALNKQISGRKGFVKDVAQGTSTAPLGAAASLLAPR